MLSHTVFNLSPGGFEAKPFGPYIAANGHQQLGNSMVPELAPITIRHGEAVRLLVR